MYRLEYSPKAIEDLKGISDHITHNWGKNTADRILKNIISDIKKLEHHPLLGPNLGRVMDITTEYRYLFTEKNYVFYNIEFNSVKIIRILKENQDFIRHLLGVIKESDDT